MNPAAFSGVPKLNWSNSTASLAFDGNSLLDPVSSTVAAKVFAAAPISGALPVKNVGIFGQTTQQMIDNSADVDALWVAGKINVLAIWEGFNSMNNGGRNAMQAIDDMRTYIAARKALHPWKVLAFVIHYTSSTFAGGNMDYANGQIDIYNDQLRTNWRAIGLSGIIDHMQPGSPFRIAESSIGVTPSLITGTGLYHDSIHLNSTGDAVVAGYVSQALRRLSAR